MASLVANYSSDDDISDDDVVNSAKCDDSRTEPPRRVNYLMSQGGSDSSDSDSGSNVKKSSLVNNSKSKECRLPNPLEANRVAESSDVHSGVTSVFKNHYAQAELAKHSVLEQHVRMTEKAPERGGRQVCWKFKKGRCHMGKNCRFFHGQDNISGASVEHGSVENERFDQPCESAFSRGRGKAFEEVEDEDSYMAGKKRKSRVGVSNQLVPPKKALSALERQRHQERPWTVNN